MRSPGRRGHGSTALAVAAALALMAPIRVGPRVLSSDRTPPPDRPNILLLVSDDQTWANFTRDLMPTVFSQLVDHGVLFTRAYDETGLCCPSRSEILTGLYEHHTGVDDQDVDLTRPTIVQTLHDLGYRTSLTGKYLNSWPCADRSEFDQWVCSGEGRSSYTLKNPTLNVDGVWTNFTGYTTDILANYTASFIAATPKDQPFFALYSPTSPHLPANDERCYGLPVTPLRPPSYDEDTQGDGKPLYEQRGPLSPTEVQWIDREHQRMTQAVSCLDGSIDTILSALGPRKSSTLVVYLSDNGFLYGEHRRSGKWVTYDESVHIPMVVRYPPLVPNAPFSSDALVENVDIAATIADLLGIHWGVDGISLAPILSKEATTVRDGALLERCQGFHFPCFPPLIPYGQPFPPSAASVVTATFQYIENVTGENELYDLVQDPYEVANLDGDPGYASQEAELAAELANLRAPPPTDTTIATGPQGQMDARVASFSFFSQSRLATYSCRLDLNGVPGPWTACDVGSVIEGPLDDGNYMFEVYGVDENGVADPTPDTRSFSVVTSGPDVSLVSTPLPHQKDGTLTFTFASSVPAVTFQCQIALYGTGGTWAPCNPSGVTYGPLADGLWLFQVKAVDQYGVSTDPPAAFLVNVDNEGPVESFQSYPDKHSRSTDASFRFLPNEPTIGRISCRLDSGVAVDCSNRVFQASGLAQGSHRLWVRATDELGNAKPTLFLWTVDLTPPVLTVSGPPRYTNQTSASILTAPNEPLDPNNPYSCALDGQNQVQGLFMKSLCSGVTSLTNLADGQHTLLLSALDAAGNLSAPTGWTWTVDTIPPVTTITSGPSDPTSDTWATFQFEATDATPVTFTCSLDGGPQAPCIPGVTYSDLAPGVHAFSVEATDSAQNVGAPALWSWTITPRPAHPRSSPTELEGLRRGLGP